MNFTRREAIASGAAALGTAMLWGPSARAAAPPGALPHTVVPATTNLLAVIGVFPSGPVNEAVLVSSMLDFQRQFGGASGFGTDSSMAVYAVSQYFLNGGVGAWIVRLDAPSSAIAQATIDPLALQAADVGVWSNGLLIEVRPSSGAQQLAGAPPGTPDHVDFEVSRPGLAGSTRVQEVIPGLPADGEQALASAINAASSYVTAAAPTATVTPDSQRFAGTTLEVGGLSLTTHAVWTREAALTATISASAAGSGLVDLTLTTVDRTAIEAILEVDNGGTPTELAAIVSAHSNYLRAVPMGTGPLLPQIQSLTAGSAGSWSVDSLESAVMAQLGEPGSSSSTAPALDQIAPAVFNLMCIPDVVFLSTASQVAVAAAAQTFCEARYAFLIVDPPPPAAALAAAWLPGAAATPIDAVATANGMASLDAWVDPLLGRESDAAATYYPWVGIADPFNDGALKLVPPSGSVAGIYATAATDTARQVWEAPAGTNAALQNVLALADPGVDDAINAVLNGRGINCLRTFATHGTVVWGARTMAGGDLYGSQLKYVSVARSTDFIQLSLRQSLKWAVFEPNGPSLWSAIVLEVKAFMAGLYGAGAFAGASAGAAYQVACDATTTTAADIAAGIVNVQVGFAPVDPAEFVALNIAISATTSG